ncbi:hypothetical protein HK414_16030 [Ramlibacter terrae]|uniref:Uncharacterized protein n=1 Tax=Ramlibacter terrae TaxID=2732511 RepID=A0ABX6P5L0_9BURK|nr:hypothetical protein HK414_16030 [Ramlibacter terrae]
MVTADSTFGNAGLASLVADLQAAIRATQFTDGTTSGTLDDLDIEEPTVRLNDGRLMLTGAYTTSIAAVTGGGAQRPGFTQIAATGATTGPLASDRRAAIDAAARGSIVNLGRSDAPSGEMTLSGWIRGHSGINLYAGNSANGNQNVNLTASGVLETLSGSMVLNPAGHAVLLGSLIAKGRGSDIIINADAGIVLSGSLTAQRDIVVTAGGTVAAGVKSIHTLGRLNSLDSGGRIILTGVNDVQVDSQIGTTSPHRACWKSVRPPGPCARAPTACSRPAPPWWSPASTSTSAARCAATRPRRRPTTTRWRSPPPAMPTSTAASSWPARCRSRRATTSRCSPPCW